jgi:fermentation-respiration switch protein FrsA (DUF1100 family)
MWYKILSIFIAILFIIILVVKRFAYFRPVYDFMPPQEKYEDIREGNLHAWYKSGTSGKIIFFCHGNAGNLSFRQSKLVELSKMGHSVLIFDYSGFGQSKGVPSEQMCYANADMFISFLLRKGYKKESIIPYGESMGAAIATYVARKYNLSAVIIEGGLPGIKHLIKYWYPKVGPLLGLLFYEFDTVSYLNGYKGKVLTMHCIHDEIVPYSITARIRDLSTIFIDMDGSHNMPIIPWGEVQKFLN